jgi:aminoglycoside phosphotransferase (APT) family kinase protein
VTTACKLAGLSQDATLNAMIDFGCLGVGDPACDVMAAWKLLSAETRDIFRAELSLDDATWARSRGWALSQAPIALAYYTRETTPCSSGRRSGGWRK